MTLSLTLHFPAPQIRNRIGNKIRNPLTITRSTRRCLLYYYSAGILLSAASACAAAGKFAEIAGSGGVKALELRVGLGETPLDGDEVAIHYYGRLAAKQGWRFDSTYDHKDETGDSVPFVFTIGSQKVIPGIEAAVKTMRIGAILRVVIPPSQGYQNTSQEPIPPNVSNIIS